MRLGQTLLALFLLGGTSDAADDLTLAVNMANKARQARGIPPLAWNSDLAAYASFWANQMGTGQQPFGHAPPQYRPQQGENIYVRSSGQCDVPFNTPLQTAMWTWLDEASL